MGQGLFDHLFDHLSDHREGLLGFGCVVRGLVKMRICKGLFGLVGLGLVGFWGAGVIRILSPRYWKPVDIPIYQRVLFLPEPVF